MTIRRSIVSILAVTVAVALIGGYFTPTATATVTPAPTAPPLGEIEGGLQTGAISVTLISVGEDWRYFKGSQAPPADWAEVGFDDSGWLIGPTGIGYGDGDDATVLSDMRYTYTTLFARKTFTLSNPASLETLTLEMDYDDGFIAYLNGVAVISQNLNSAANTATATYNHEAGSPEQYNLDAHLDKLQAGTNVLAVVGANVSLSSSDFSLIPALTARQTTPAPATPIIAYTRIYTNAATGDTVLYRQSVTAGDVYIGSALWAIAIILVYTRIMIVLKGR